MDQQFVEKVEAFLAQNRDDIVKDIAAVVAVRSVQEAPAPGAPFGAGPRKALDVTLDIAKRLGFATNDGEGYVGWAELPGKEKGHIATMTHVDIVPEGEGWDADPLTLVEKDGWIIGRGVNDDKGPGILCLYLLKFFKEQGIELRYGLRALFGSNEETGMQDVEYYLAHHEEPLFCFSPDADFPLCNGEKGVYEGEFSSGKLAGSIVEFEGGLASNVIPHKATCVVKTGGKALANTQRVTVTDNGDGTARLDSLGIGGHAAMPEETINGIGLLVDYLLDNGLCQGEEKAYLELMRTLHSVTDGSGLGIDSADPAGMFTPLTAIGGTVHFAGGVLKQGINVRYPTSTTGKAITAALSAKAAACGGSFHLERDAKPFYISADNAAIQALLDTYNEVNGSNEKPFTIGGGTYARHFKNAVSYGPSSRGMEFPDFVGPEHAANEGANIDKMLRALKIYILAVMRLQDVDF